MKITLIILAIGSLMVSSCSSQTVETNASDSGIPADKIAKQVESKGVENHPYTGKPSIPSLVAFNGNTVKEGLDTYNFAMTNRLTGISDDEIANVINPIIKDMEKSDKIEVIRNDRKSSAPVLYLSLSDLGNGMFEAKLSILEPVKVIRLSLIHI